jgi:hypothetical protein
MRRVPPHRSGALVRTICGIAAMLTAGCVSLSDGSRLPDRLSDEQFWSLVTQLSEPGGEFKPSENLVSNEPLFVHTVRLMRARGGVYIGVGPEQNFSYIARVRPAMAFVLDIREQNRTLHLLYKALFEGATDRVDFVSRLFSRERPSGLDTGSSAHEIFSALQASPRSVAIRDATLQRARERLIAEHGLPIAEHDLQTMARILAAFYDDGPDIHYGRLLPPGAAGPSYRTLMTATDLAGLGRSYLASEEAFAFVKALHVRNLIVPVVGNFGGTGAIRRLGEYIRRQDSWVSAFYASNVEVYLSNQQMKTYCESLALLPHEPSSWFVGGKGLQPFATKLQNCPPKR